jgi:hypothetical protein
MTDDERTIQVVLISAGSKRGYPYWVYRVVECRVGQRGWRSERGVEVLWESGILYRPTTVSGRGVGPETAARARRIAEKLLLERLGV